MIRVIQILLCAYVLVSAAGPANFPLWGSTWYVAQGYNLKVFPSVLKYSPKTVMKVKWGSDRSVTLSWANLQHKYFSGTAEALNETTEQLALPDHQLRVSPADVNAGKGVDISFKTVTDTLYSFFPAIERLRKTSNWTSVRLAVPGVSDIIIIERSPSVPERSISSVLARFPPELRFDMMKPQATIFRAKRANESFSLAMSGTDGAQWLVETDSKGQPLDNDRYYDVAQRVVVENLEEFDKMDYQVTSVGHWQVHLYPVVTYFPRSDENGKPFILPEYAVTKDVASANKTASINDPTNVGMRMWRDPYLSDSASAIISFAFTLPEGAKGNRLSYIWLSSIKAGSTAKYDHYPEKMYRSSDMNEALRKLCTTTDQEEQFASTLETRCPNWKTLDIRNGLDIFPMEARMTWPYYKVKLGLIPGTKGIGKQQAYDKKFRWVLVKDPNVDDGVYEYDGCPCSREPGLGNRTKAEVQKLVYMPFPKYRFRSMERAAAIYKQLAYYLTAPTDRAVLSQKADLAWRLCEQKLAYEGRRGLTKDGYAENLTVKGRYVYHTKLYAKDAFLPASWADKPENIRIIGE